MKSPAKSQNIAFSSSLNGVLWFPIGGFSEIKPRATQVFPRVADYLEQMHLYMRTFSDCSNWQ